jgi:hypothetical protein
VYSITPRSGCVQTVWSSNGEFIADLIIIDGDIFRAPSTPTPCAPDRPGHVDIDFYNIFLEESKNINKFKVISLPDSNVCTSTSRWR